ncbi:MAG TPA: FtsX-like permease family protein, partial [Ktedonobacterales bacterium]
ALVLLRQFLPASVLANTSSSYLSGLLAPQAALIPALAGALLGVATVASAALQSARLEVLAFRREQARPSRAPIWQRYYLDLALVALCIIAYLDLNQFGSTNVRVQLGGGSSPLLLLAPALLLVAGALLVLRAIPLGAKVAAGLASRGRGFIAMLALSQVERTPNRYTRITLLLVLAVGLGLFAVTFDASLAQNAHDRAAYSTGADVRLQMRGVESGDQGTKLGQQLAALPGVQGVMRAYRSTARTSPDVGDLQVDTLGIDPATFAQAAGITSWRADYASVPLATLLRDMNANRRKTPNGPPVGSGAAPLYALVSQTFADQNALHVGDQFSLQLDETSFGQTTFVVGHIVQEFPTLYPTHSPGGFLVVGIDDYEGAIQTSAAASGVDVNSVPVGPNEFWLKTTSGTSQDSAQQAALLKALQNATLDVKTALSLDAAIAANAANPVGAGIRGLLVVGAITAALLAVLGSVIQSLLATRQRATQLAILRTLGTARSQLTGLLLCEQIVVYLFGLLGGTLLGLLLTTATLPFLQFSDTLGDASRLGVPSYVLVYDPQGMVYFYGALLVAFALALVAAAQYAARIGLGQALRLGED